MNKKTYFKKLRSKRPLPPTVVGEVTAEDLVPKKQGIQKSKPMKKGAPKKKALKPETKKSPTLQKKKSKNVQKVDVKLDKDIAKKYSAKLDSAVYVIKRVISTINGIVSQQDFAEVRSEFKLDVDILKDVMEDVQRLQRSIIKVKFSNVVPVDVWDNTYNLIDRVQNSIMSRILELALERGLPIKPFNTSAIHADRDLSALENTIRSLEDAAVDIAATCKEILYKATKE